MEGDLPLPVAFNPGDLRSAQPPGAPDADAQGSGFPRHLHRLLHRAPVGNPPFDLKGDVFGHELRIELRPLHFLHVNEHLAVLRHQLLDLLAQLVELDRLPADHQSRTAGMDVDPHPVAGPLDHHLRDRRSRQLRLDQTADLKILVDVFRKQPFVGVPDRPPLAVHRQAKTDRINFLPHIRALFLFLWFQDDAYVARPLADRAGASPGLGLEALDGRRLSDPCFLYQEITPVQAMVVFRVGQRGGQCPPDVARAFLRKVGEHRQRLFGAHALNASRYVPELESRHAHEPVDRLHLHKHSSIRIGRPPYFAVAFSVCAPCRLKTRVGENSPRRWPTMFSVT
ncbi:protein of unknown function [Methylacidimicrobium sp. AP8]|nr:protein of unknown function [Methylacidimicrobium sp. AP8]